MTLDFWLQPGGIAYLCNGTMICNNSNSPVEILENPNGCIEILELKPEQEIRITDSK